MVFIRKRTSMTPVEQKALETYHKNLEYFKNNHSELFKKLSVLDMAITSGQYNENYALEYKEGEYFDVQDLSTGEWFYGENSNDYTQRILNITSLHRSGGVFEGLRRVPMSQDYANLINTSNVSFHNHMWALSKLSFLNQIYSPKETSEMLSVKKVIILGVGLGLHIEAVFKKLKNQVCFIAENNIELFRLSLFVTPYYSILKDIRAHFSIAETDELEKINFITFLESAYNYNLYIKHIPFYKEYESSLKKYQNYVISQNHILYPYNAYLIRYTTSPQYIFLEKPILNISKNYENNIFSKKPILFIGSGPSSSIYIDWIKENYKNFVVICPLSTCRLLHKHNIKPDIIVHIDPQEENSLKLLDGISDDFFNKSTFLFSTNINKKIVEKLSQHDMYFIQQATDTKVGFGSFTSPTVGEYTYAISVILGAKKLFLIGLDLALNQTTLSTHNESHAFEKKLTINPNENSEASLSPDHSLIHVKGNFQEQVFTTPKFKVSIDEFKRLTSYLRNIQYAAYNLSQGAYLDGAEPLEIEKVKDKVFLPALEKETLQNEIKSFLISIASSEVREEDINHLLYQITEAKRLKKIILKFQKKRFKSPNSYMNELSLFATELSDMHNVTKSELSEVFYHYFKMSLAYIYDTLNTKEALSQEKNIITIINKEFTSQLLKIADYYIQSLENYLK